MGACYSATSPTAEQGRLRLSQGNSLSASLAPAEQGTGTPLDAHKSLNMPQDASIYSQPVVPHPTPAGMVTIQGTTAPSTVPSASPEDSAKESLRQPSNDLVSFPYAAPFIPSPSGLPPPECPNAAQLSSVWQPSLRRALLVAANYTANQHAPLRGCVRDIGCLRNLLVKQHRFQPEDIVMLHDDQADSQLLPTKAALLRGMKWLVSGCQPQTSLFLAFCGLGTEESDENSQQRSGAEQAALLPCDHVEAGAVTADEVAACLALPLSAGVRLHVVVDACLDTCILDLPHVTRSRPDYWAAWQAQQKEPQPEEPVTHQHRGEIMLLSCRGGGDLLWDPDVLSGAQSTGATIFAFAQAVLQGQAGTYNQLLRAMRYALKNGPPHLVQQPYLASSLAFDLNCTFRL